MPQSNDWTDKRNRDEMISMIKEGINEAVKIAFKRRCAHLFAKYHRGEIAQPTLDDFISLLRRNEKEHLELAQKTVGDMESVERLMPLTSTVPKGGDHYE